jgi:putative flippase GtrA
MTGAGIAFILGRNWTFLNKEGEVTSQGFKFLVIMAGSVTLNTLGVYVFTEYFGIEHYTISKLIVAILVGIGWNFPMQRNFVFK